MSGRHLLTRGPGPTSCADRGHFVEERQRAIGHLEEHRVPARMARPVGLDTGRDLDGCGPCALGVPGYPDADVWRALACSPEPRRDQSFAGVGDRRRVNARKGRRLEQELRVHDSRCRAALSAERSCRDRLARDRQDCGGTKRGILHQRQLQLLISSYLACCS